MRLQRPARGSQQPGTHFFYNNWDFDVLGSIYKKQTGRSVAFNFQQKIAAKIGMQDFNVKDFTEIRKPRISDHAASAVTRFGWLYLQNGTGKGNRSSPLNGFKKAPTVLGLISQVLLRINMVTCGGRAKVSKRISLPSI